MVLWYGCFFARVNFSLKLIQGRCAWFGIGILTLYFIISPLGIVKNSHISDPRRSYQCIKILVALSQKYVLNQYSVYCYFCTQSIDWVPIKRMDSIHAKTACAFTWFTALSILTNQYIAKSKGLWLQFMAF